MKTFKTRFAVCIALLCLSANPLLAVSPLRVNNPIAAISSASVSAPNTTHPNAPDCTTCTANVLINPSFEDQDPFKGWTKSKTGWGIDGTYAVCGVDAAVLQNEGLIYQDVQVVPNTEVTFSIWGGYHKASSQTFKLSFLDADKKVIATTVQAKAVDWDVDTAPANGPILRKYSFTGTAPANALFVRVEATAISGDWFKIDNACMTLKAPAVSCGCDGNVLKNASFEESTTVGGKSVPSNWQSSNTNFTSDGAYAVCGSKNGLITNSGSFWQDVKIAGGSTASLTIWGGYHNQNGQVFKLQFVMSDGTIVTGDSKTLNKAVEAVPRTSNVGLTQYSLAATAPAGAKYVRVFGSSNGDYLKVDAACLSISVPVCETCNDNKLLNPGFETGTADWTKVVGTFEASEDYVVCGTKSGKLTGKSTIAQKLSADPGASVTFSIYAGVNIVNGQKIRLRFLNVDGGELSFKETAVTKVYTAATIGLQKCTVSDRAPQNTKFVSVELVSNGDNFIFDLGCLSIVGGTPLPVTLTEFGVKKEGNAASLAWKTTMETNSKEFEVQHSLDGKQWEILGIVAAEGESTVLKSYSFVHASPIQGSNLYRLRMVDNDLTFAYSRIISEVFTGGESVLLYPNPSSDVMKLKSGADKVSRIQIYDVRGIKVRDFAPSGLDIDIRSLDQGTYIVTFKNTSGLITKQRIQVVR